MLKDKLFKRIKYSPLVEVAIYYIHKFDYFSIAKYGTCSCCIMYCLLLVLVHLLVIRAEMASELPMLNIILCETFFAFVSSSATEVCKSFSNSPVILARNCTYCNH